MKRAMVLEVSSSSSSEDESSSEAVAPPATKRQRRGSLALLRCKQRDVSHALIRATARQKKLNDEHAALQARIARLDEHLNAEANGQVVRVAWDAMVHATSRSHQAWTMLSGRAPAAFSWCDNDGCGKPAVGRSIFYWADQGDEGIIVSVCATCLSSIDDCKAAFKRTEPLVFRETSGFRMSPELRAQFMELAPVLVRLTDYETPWVAYLKKHEIVLTE
jgi:hypothetical protein